MLKIKENERGITLVALVITIIVLLILAGITITQLIGSALFEKAKLAKEKYRNAQDLENSILSEYEDINAILDGSSSRTLPQEQSSVITGVSFTANPAATSITLNINIESSDESKIVDYHAFAINKNDNTVTSTECSKNKQLTLNNLSITTTYEVYVAAYDVYNNFRKSEVTEITTFSEQNLVPILTSNTSGGGTAFATYTANGRSAWEAFDGKIPEDPRGDVSGYVVSNSSTNQIGYDFGQGNQRTVTKIVYYGQPYDANCRFTTITLQYSDDNSTWTNVHTFTPGTITTNNRISVGQEFRVTNPTSSHRYWRINATNSGYSWSGLLELQFWGN